MPSGKRASKKAPKKPRNKTPKPRPTGPLPKLFSVVEASKSAGVAPILRRKRR